MSAVVLSVVFLVGLINASFVGVVVAELAQSRPAGVAAALLTLVIEAILVRKLRQAITAPSSSSPSQPGSPA